MVSSLKGSKGARNGARLLFWGVLAFIVYKFADKIRELFRSVFGSWSFGMDDKVHTGNQAAYDKVPEPVATKMTISNAQAKTFAERLRMAMHRGSFLPPDMDGTNEAEIFAVFAFIKNADDFRAIYKAFGVKDHAPSLIAQQGQWYDLVGWLREELSDSDYQKISSKIP